MMKISSLTLIPMMFYGILLFSSPAFSQDRSDQTQITRSDYISMDKQVSILEFRVKELEKNSDKIDALKSDILSNKANLHFLNILSTGVYALIFAIVALTSYFTFTRTKEKTTEQCKEWFKNNREEIIETVEKQANAWLTDNKNEVIQHIKVTLSTAFLESLDQKDGKKLIRQVICDEISKISNDPTTPKNIASQNNRQHLEQDSIVSENFIIEDSMPSPQDNFSSIKTDENSEEQEAAELFKTAFHSHGIKQITTYSQLIEKFTNSNNEKILLLVAKSYYNLAVSSDKKEAINIYRELIERFENSSNENILLCVVTTYVNLGTYLNKKEAINNYRKAIDLFKDNQNKKILLQVAKAYYNLGSLLQEAEKIKIYRIIIELLKDDSNEEASELLADTYYNLASLINKHEQNDIYHLIIKHFGNCNNENILAIVANTYYNLAYSLTGQKAIDIYRLIIKRFAQKTNEDILEVVAQSYINQSIEHTNINQRSEAIQLLSEAIQKFKQSDSQKIKLQLAKMEFLYNSLLQNS